MLIGVAVWLPLVSSLIIKNRWPSGETSYVRRSWPRLLNPA